MISHPVNGCWTDFKSSCEIQLKNWNWANHNKTVCIKTSADIAFMLIPVLKGLRSRVDVYYLLCDGSKIIHYDLCTCIIECRIQLYVERYINYMGYDLEPSHASCRHQLLRATPSKHHSIWKLWKFCWFTLLLKNNVCSQIRNIYFVVCCFLAPKKFTVVSGHKFPHWRWTVKESIWTPRIMQNHH